MNDDRVSAYAARVLSGEVIAGPHVRAACKRHFHDLKTAKARGLVFDYDAAERVFRFFETVLRLSEGQFEGAPFKLHESQAFILGSIFGWKRTRDGFRRFRRAYIEQGKGNGKSPLVGGIGLYGMACDREPGAQIYAAAAVKDQADILFGDAVNMVQKAPDLAKRVTFSGKMKPWKMTMRKKPQAGSFFKPLSRETKKTGSGPRPHMALLDEVHEHPDRDTIDILERGFKFRRQPLLAMITNSGSDRNSCCWQEREHAVSVVHGDTEDDATFAYVCALDKGDDPLKNPACWIKANPLLGVILSHEYLADVVKQAVQMPGKTNNILRLHFCVWTDAETAWITRQMWEACEDPGMTLEEFEGKRCTAGLDLSSTKDLTAKALVFDDGFKEVQGKDGERTLKPCFAAFAHGYTPKDTLEERVKADKAPYDLWVKAGHITATPGKIIRHDLVAADLVADAARFDLASVAYDRWLIRHFEDELAELGATLPLAEHPQGINRRQDTPLWMPESINTLEALIYEGRLRVHVNPALRSAVASATFWTSPAELRRFEKAKATKRIDLLIALTMAIGAASNSSAVEESVYEKLARASKDRKETVAASSEIDYAILNDPRHPQFKEMAARFERMMRARPDED
jgi:phage terminase large subunit-like protein